MRIVCTALLQAIDYLENYHLGTEEEEVQQQKVIQYLIKKTIVNRESLIGRNQDHITGLTATEQDHITGPTVTEQDHITGPTATEQDHVIGLTHTE